MMQATADFIEGAGGELLLFGALSLLTLLSAIFVVTARRVTHACVSLLPCFIGIAGLYGMLSSPIMLAFQLLIYAGGIMVLLLFAIFLLERRAGPILASNHQVLPALLIAGFTAIIILGAVRQVKFSKRGLSEPRDELVLDEFDTERDWYGYYEIQTDEETEETTRLDGEQRSSNVRRTGFYFLTYYLLPFELTSLILVIAMVGAIIMARREKGWVAAGRIPGETHTSADDTEGADGDVAGRDPRPTKSEEGSE